MLETRRLFIFLLQQCKVEAVPELTIVGVKPWKMVQLLQFTETPLKSIEHFNPRGILSFEKIFFSKNQYKSKCMIKNQFWFTAYCSISGNTRKFCSICSGLNLGLCKCMTLTNFSSVSTSGSDFLIK